MQILALSKKLLYKKIQRCCNLNLPLQTLKKTIHALLSIYRCNKWVYVHCIIWHIHFKIQVTRESPLAFGSQHKFKVCLLLANNSIKLIYIKWRRHGYDNAVVSLGFREFFTKTFFDAHTNTKIDIAVHQWKCTGALADGINRLLF